MLSNTGLFTETNENLYSRHLPAKLHAKLFVMGLLDKKQLSFQLNEGKTIEFKLMEELNPNSIYPDVVSISITNTFPAVNSKTDTIVSKNIVYNFTNKNALHSYSGDKNTQNNNYNYMALLGSENVLSKAQTEEFTTKIISEINKTRSNSATQELDCRCAIF